MPNESNLPAGHPTETAPPDALRGPGYEVRDTNVRAVVVFLAGMFLVLLVVVVGLRGLLNSLRGRGSNWDRSVENPDVITEQLLDLRRYEADVLAGKARAGKESSGRAVLPIETAIEVLAERGIPPVPGPPKTEAEVNSHSAGGVPADPPRADNNTTGGNPAAGRSGPGPGSGDAARKKGERK